MLEGEKAGLLWRLPFLKGAELRLAVILIWSQVIIKMRVHPQSKILVIWLVMPMLVAPVLVEQGLADKCQK